MDFVIDNITRHIFIHKLKMFNKSVSALRSFPVLITVKNEDFTPFSFTKGNSQLTSLRESK